MHANPKSPRVAIVGLGPRGLCVLERFVAALRAQPQARLHIDCYDPRPPGAGLHEVDQPDYLMLNTIAGQLTVFPEGPADGPDFLAWCHALDIRLDERGHPRTDGRPVSHGDFLPRRLLARYLIDSHVRLITGGPPNLSIAHHSRAVIDCRARTDAPGHCLVTDDGAQQDVDAVFLTLGHTGMLHQPNDLPRALPAAPLPDVLNGITPGSQVAVVGLGLTAMDVVASLTEGRGGRHVHDGEYQQHYVRSGHEPSICLYSSSGQPFHARPHWHGSADYPWRPTFLTRYAIDTLRARTPDHRLDFERDLLPLLKDEMRAAWYRCLGRIKGQAAAKHIEVLLANAVNDRDAFDQLAKAYRPFEPAVWLATDGWRGQRDLYPAWLRSQLLADLRESRRGIGYSPIKAALEVWRQARDLLRHAVDGRGLTEDSARGFYNRWAALSNRLVGGPQKERHEDLIALIDAGVVRVLPPMRAEPTERGYVLVAPEVPNDDAGIEVDHVIAAWLPASRLRASGSPLLNALLACGELRPAGAPPLDGIEVDPFGRTVRADGHVQPRLWALGPNVEGSTFYNHYVATVDPQCRCTLDAQLAATICLDTLGLSPCTGKRSEHADALP